MSRSQRRAMELSAHPPRKRQLDPASSTQQSLKAEHLSQMASPLSQPSARKRFKIGPLRILQQTPQPDDEAEVEEDDNGDEQDDDDQEAEGEGDPDDVQRTGRNRRTSPSLATEADQHSRQPSSSRTSGRQQRTAPLAQRSSDDGYLPGSIRRVALYQFVTYDFVEFHPGPNLNMIIGPNGTGKSTIASGIALGLGWSTSVLSRQKDLADFVKNDCQEGWIELELQGLPGEGNIVIRRTLVKTDNTSDWFLNGRKSSKREVTERVGDFEIDVSNLCSFLPQDKVAAFARMSPQEVLVETEKMAGDAHLYRWHSKLEQVGKVLSAKAAALELDIKQRDNLKERNEALERDIRRFEEREKMEKNIFDLKVKILNAKYSVALQELQALREEKDRVKARLKKAEEAGKPVKAKKEELRTEIKDAESQLKRQREATRTEERNANRLIREIEQRGVEIDGLHDEMKSLNIQEEQRKRAIQTLRAEIAKRKDTVRSDPPEVDLTEIKLQVRSVDQEDREVQDKLSQIASDKSQISTESTSFGRSRDDIKRRLESLEDVKAQRLERLRQGDPAAHTAVVWLRDNQGLFQKPVYEPILLEINVKDPVYADAVESCINWPLFKTFVCQTRVDYDLFTREVIDQRRLRVTVAEVENMNLENFRPPATAEQLQAFGLEKYVLDLIDGPRDVLTYLCSSASLHTIPVARNEVNVDIERVENSRIFRRFIVGGTTFTISYSSYGKRAAQTASRLVNQARNLARSIDDRMKKQLDDQIRAIQQKISDQELQMAPLIRQEGVLRKDQEAIARRRAELLSEKRQKESARSEWEKSRVDLERLKKRLENEEQRPSVEAKRQSCLQRRRKLVHMRAQVAQRLKVVMQEMIKTHPEVDVLSFQKLQLETNLRHLERLSEDHRATLNELITEKEEASKRLQVSTTQAKRLQEQSRELAENAQGYELDFESDVEESLEDLQANLSRLEMAFENAQGIRPGVKEQFDARKKEIAALDNKIQGAEEEKIALEGRLQSTKAKWQPALAELVNRVNAKFSAAFDSLGCAGEVRIKEAEKFEDWGIEILVKFREEASLQVLTGQQQSGGERSLSTIMYLMSLTELSRSPFSLVDEINQGMDQRAERSVHNHMVDVTCQAEASQYFLITPKLLTDLRYHPKMRVLVVNNGDWAIKKSRFHDYVAIARRRLGVAQ